MHSQLSAAKLLALFTALMLLCTAPLAAQTLGANFTYQGQLKQGGNPLNATADFEFKLFNALTAGTQIGSTQPVSGVNVVDGLFTVSLDFGTTSFNGDKRWLEIHVRSPAGAGAFTVLTPRQPLAATPYALYALTGPGSGGPWAVSGNDIFNTNTGKVGIGTTSPQELFNVNGNIRWGGTSTNFVRSGQDGSGLFLEQAGSSPAKSNIRLQSSKSSDFINYSQFIIDPNNGFSFRSLGTGNGNVGIGTTTPTRKLHVEGTGSDAVIYAKTSSAGPLVMGVLGVSDNNIGVKGEGFIGVAGSSVHPDGTGVNGSSNIGVRAFSTSIIGFDFFAAGPGTDYGTSSSVRWKRNIELIDDPLRMLAQLRGVYFDWDAEHGGHHAVGMIAEEVGAILPEIVNYEANGVDAIGMDYSKLTPLLVEGVKALKAKNDAQQDQIDVLAAENDGLRARIEALEQLLNTRTLLESE